MSRGKSGKIQSSPKETKAAKTVRPMRKTVRKLTAKPEAKATSVTPIKKGNKKSSPAKKIPTEKPVAKQGVTAKKNVGAAKKSASRTEAKHPSEKSAVRRSQRPSVSQQPKRRKSVAAADSINKTLSQKSLTAGKRERCVNF